MKGKWAEAIDRFMTPEWAIGMDREQIRRELLARSEARSKTLKFKIERGFMLTLIALAWVSALASFFVKGHMGHDPKLALAVLLTTPSLALSLLGRKSGFWTEKLTALGAYVGGALFLCVFLQWMGW
jgi:hypothetical protein